MHGMSRSKTVPVDKVEAFARARAQFLWRRIRASTPRPTWCRRAACIPSRTTPTSCSSPTPIRFRVIPWLDKTASVVCLGYEYDGEPQRAAPRWVFSDLVQQANELGYDVMMGHEYEYYLLEARAGSALYEGIHIFHTVRNHYAPFLDQLVPTLRAYGIDVITHNCEYAGSQYETVYGPGHEPRRPPTRPSPSRTA